MMKKESTISIAKQQEVPLLKEQKQFNRLNNQIAKQKELLLNWQTKIAEFKTMYMNELAPLEQKHKNLIIQMIYLFDKVYDDKVFTNTERKKMLYFIEELAQDFAIIDEKVKEIYNRRGDNDFDEEQTFMKEMSFENLKVSASEHLDIDLDNIQADNAEALMEELARHIQQQIEEDKKRQAKRKKSTKTLEKEAMLAQKDVEVSQSIKDVYRQLVKTLHPDRETDLNERERKTELMQKINTAYNKNDLLTLLHMQLEVEHINQNSISQLSVDKIKHYNIILKKQLQEIQQEIYFVQEQFNMEFDILSSEVVSTPDWIVIQLKHEAKRLEKEIKQFKNDLEAWQEPLNLKSYLKNMRV